MWSYESDLLRYCVTMYKYKLFGCYMSEMWSGVYHNITMYCFTSFTNIHGPKNICWAKIILYIVTLAADVLFQSNGGVITMAMDGLSFTFLWIVSWTIHQLWEEFFDINSHFTLSLNPTNTLPPCLPPCWSPCQPFFFSDRHHVGHLGGRLVAMSVSWEFPLIENLLLT